MSVTLLAASCSGEDDSTTPPIAVVAETPSATPALATVDATVVDAATQSELGAAARSALLGIMVGGEDPFAGSPDALPPEMIDLVHALGVDLRLGVSLTEQDEGLTIVAVFWQSPAERAGLVAGDVVLAIAGVPGEASTTLSSADELRAAVQATTPGTLYTLDVDRSGASLAIAVEREADESAEWRSALLTSLALGLLMGDGGTGSNSLLGEMVEETPDGLLVTSVFPNSPADMAGLLAGDILTSIDGQPLVTIVDHSALFDSPPPLGKEITIMVLRDGAEVDLIAVVAPSY